MFEISGIFQPIAFWNFFSGCDCRSGPRKINQNTVASEKNPMQIRGKLAELIDSDATPLHMAAALGLVECVSPLLLLLPSTGVGINCQVSVVC